MNPAPSETYRQAVRGAGMRAPHRVRRFHLHDGRHRGTITRPLLDLEPVRPPR